MTTRIGTEYFIGTAAAIRYYRTQGIGEREVRGKIADGSIKIGSPPKYPGELSRHSNSEGRIVVVCK